MYFTNIKEESRRKNLPRNIFYGDGQPIEIEVLNYIREAYNQEKKFKWQKRDIMMLDNILTVHSREAYKEGKKSYSCYCLDL